MECDAKKIGQVQQITHDDVVYHVTLKAVQWQPSHGSYRYRLVVESDGLGWHSRSLSDVYDMCGAPDWSFVTLFHTKKREPLETIARAFFGRRWSNLNTKLFRSLAVSRFLAASIASAVAEKAFHSLPLTHYPEARLIGGMSPMLASGHKLWVGHRFFSEDAYAWARRSAGRASRVIALYFADTKYQFKTDLPAGSEVQSIAHLDFTELEGQFDDLIRILLRGLELPIEPPDPKKLSSIVLGRTQVPAVPVSEADVHEALAALKRTCRSKAELRYQLAAAVVLNAWIESERRLGFFQRKKFYAFKQKVDSLVNWAIERRLPGVKLWAEKLPGAATTVLYVRINGVDFSFHAIPSADKMLDSNSDHLRWSGVRLKPIAPLVLAWARGLLPPSTMD